MKINYIGHSCFLFYGSGVSLVTDPFGSVGLPFPHLKADIVTVSHGHYDHANVRAVSGAKAVFAEAGKFSFGGVKIEAFESFHDDANGSKRGKNLIFSFVMDGLRVCHMGDLGQKFDENILKQIGKPDILLIPVGGNYTIDGDEAAWYVKKISPAVTIPMHYLVRGLTVDIEDEKRFLHAMDDHFTAAGELQISKETLPSAPQIIVMERE